MNNPIQKIVIVGRDADAWITALMLQMSFANANPKITIQLVELPSRLNKHDFFSVLPSHKILHNVLGLKEGATLKSAGGLYSLAQRFSNWSGPAAPFLHAYDTQGVNFLNVDFLQYWLRANRKGLRIPLEDFSLGAVAAKQGKFAVFADAGASFSKATYGYHLSALEYLRMVGNKALKAGLDHTAGELKSVEVVNQRIESIVLTDDSRIHGDLFIDVTGTAASLISQLEQNNLESWEQWFPCDRMVVGSAPVLKPAPAFSQISAFKEGWLGIYPLLNRTAVTASYSSKFSNRNQVLQALPALTGLKINEVIESPLAPAIRKASWIGNCIALGNASVTLDSLDASSLHMLHIGLSLVRSLFPADKKIMPEASVFNEKLNAHAENVRDFQIAHYALNKRFDERLWDQARQVKLPATLQQKINLFASRGRVALFENETFQEENWTSLFVGHGILPNHIDPLVERMSEQEQMGKFQQLLKQIASEVSNMPSMEAHVELNSF